MRAWDARDSVAVGWDGRDGHPRRVLQIIRIKRQIVVCGQLVGRRLLVDLVVDGLSVVPR